jgi:hypothetical protein
MEELPTVGDLVKFKKHCVPSYNWAQRDFIYLVSGSSGSFLRLHDMSGLVSRENFDIVSAAR